MKIKINFIKILEIFSIILGIFISLLILWNRVLRERLPRILDGNYEPYQMFVFVLLLFTSLFSIIISIKNILNIPLEPKNKYIIKFIELELVKKISYYIYEYILKAPEHAGIWFFNTINIIDYIRDFGCFIWKQDPYKHTKILVYSMYIIRIFVSIIFLIDVLIFHQFFYFYKIAILLIIPVLFKIFLFVIKDSSEFNRKYYTEHYIVVESNKEINKFEIDFHPSYKGDTSEAKLDHLGRIWFYFLANCMFVDHIKDYENATKYYISLMCNTLYIIGWLYIIYTFFILE